MLAEMLENLRNCIAYAPYFFYELSNLQNIPKNSEQNYGG
jgi:hypothetical protein